MRTAGALLAVAGALGAIGCGPSRQDANETSGTWKIAVTKFQFAAKQHIGSQEPLTITVQNKDSRRIPAVAVTLIGTSFRANHPGDADPNRPIWILDSAPRGGATAQGGTWILPGVAPGVSRVFQWKATPVVGGQFPLKYKVAAGLHGNARATLEDGTAPEGAMQVDVSKSPDIHPVN